MTLDFALQLLILLIFWLQLVVWVIDRMTRPRPVRHHDHLLPPTPRSPRT